MKYLFINTPVEIRNDHVYRNGNFIGYCYTDEHGDRYVLGPRDKGKLTKVI